LNYVVRWRKTDSNQWQYSKTDFCLPRLVHWSHSTELDRECQVVLPHIRVDDWVFGVSSVSKYGFESPVASAVPGGAFKPYVAPPGKP
jgi:hypothetical protein